MKIKTKWEARESSNMLSQAESAKDWDSQFVFNWVLSAWVLNCEFLIFLKVWKIIQNYLAKVFGKATSQNFQLYFIKSEDVVVFEKNFQRPIQICSEIQWKRWINQLYDIKVALRAKFAGSRKFQRVIFVKFETGRKSYELSTGSSR